MLPASLPSLLLVSHLTLSCELLTEDCHVLTCFLKGQTVVCILKDNCGTMTDVISLLTSWKSQLAASLRNLVANC